LSYRIPHFERKYIYSFSLLIRWSDQFDLVCKTWLPNHLFFSIKQILKFLIELNILIAASLNLCAIMQFLILDNWEFNISFWKSNISFSASRDTFSLRCSALYLLIRLMIWVYLSSSSFCEDTIISCIFRMKSSQDWSFTSPTSKLTSSFAQKIYIIIIPGLTILFFLSSSSEYHQSIKSVIHIF